MKLKTNARPDAHRALQQAGNILSRGGNRLLLCEAVILCLFLVGVYVMLHSVYSIATALFAATAVAKLLFGCVYGLLVSALALFVTLPLLVGLCDLARCMEKGDAPVLADLFLPFSAKAAYRRAWSLSWSAFYRVFFLVAIATATCYAGIFFAGELVWMPLVCGLLVLAEVLAWLALALRRFYWLGAFEADTEPKRSRSRAERMRRRDPHGGARFYFAVLPRILLGFLTLGIYLLWDVLPRMSVAYFSYCRQLEEMIQTEER